MGNVPERCFIDNSDIKDKRVSRNLNKNWYIDLAMRRLNGFGISDQTKLDI